MTVSILMPMNRRALTKTPTSTQARRRRRATTGSTDNGLSPGRGNVRSPEPGKLRASILAAAVASLIENGSARTTTLAVQRRAGVSRGALLHHFPTHAALLAATVCELVRQNERAVHEGLAALADTGEPFERAVRVLARATSQPAYLAELELWAVARTDLALHAALAVAERAARKESDRVMKSLFAPGKEGTPQAEVLAMTLEFLRGLALTGILRKNPARREKLITQWVRTTRILLATTR